MPVVATAGHVDHGKSTLVLALTGTDPDRLPEEKARGMTIDLGFAPLQLPSGQRVGLVDVPGHQRFIHNMLAGVGGIDAALLVVDLTEGWMPQTEEHVEILELLGVPCAAAALTKADLVDDEWAALVAEEVSSRLHAHGFRDVPLITVSSVTRQGLDRLLLVLQQRLAELPPAEDRAWPRLWIDRVLKIRGAGVVVTGTLTGGSLETGQEIVVHPGGQRGRIRSLQSHGARIDSAQPGSRVALNLLGVEYDQLQRGQAVVLPDDQALSPNPVVRIRAARRGGQPVHSGERLTCFVGTAEVAATVRLLGADQLPPGAVGMAQLLLESPLPLRWKDRLILRDPARQLNAAGCQVLEPQAERLRGRRLLRQPGGPLRRRYRSLFGTPHPPADVAALQAMASEELQQAVCGLVALRGALAVQALSRELHMPADACERALADAERAGKAVRVGAFAVSPDALQRLTARVQQAVSVFHERQPLAPGMPRQTLLTELGIDERLFDALLPHWAQQGVVEWDEAAVVRRPGFRPRLAEGDLADRDRLLRLLESQGFTPPTLEELTGREGFRPQLIALLVAQGDLVRVSQDLVFTAGQMRRVMDVVRALAGRSGGTVEPAAVRDALSSTRRFIIPLLEYLDRVGFTRRVGDRRELVGETAVTRSSRSP